MATCPNVIIFFVFFFLCFDFIIDFVVSCLLTHSSIQMNEKKWGNNLTTYQFRQISKYGGRGQLHWRMKWRYYTKPNCRGCGERPISWEANLACKRGVPTSGGGCWVGKPNFHQLRFTRNQKDHLNWWFTRRLPEAPIAVFFYVFRALFWYLSPCANTAFGAYDSPLWCWRQNHAIPPIPPG